MLPDGKYAIPAGTDSCRSFWLKTITGDLGKVDEGSPAAGGYFGKRLLYFRTPRGGWRSFAFLNPKDDSVQFHVRFFHSCNEQQIESLRSAMREIVAAPQKASILYRESEKWKRDKEKAEKK